MFTLLTIFTSALTAFAGPVAPLPGQPAPGLENVFFQPVKLLDADFCFTDGSWGIADGDPLHIAPCPGNFGSWIWKPVQASGAQSRSKGQKRSSQRYHLTLLGTDRCIGYSLSEQSKKNGAQVVFANCDAPGYQTEWVWKGDNLCSDDGPLSQCIGVEGAPGNGTTLRTSTKASKRKAARLTSVVIGTQ